MPPPAPGVSPPQPPAPHTAPPRRSRGRILLRTGLAIIAFEAVVLVVALWLFGYFDRPVLDVNAAEAGVRLVLSDPIYGYGANEVTSVECNNGSNPVVGQGKGFTCQVIINGARRQVDVVFRDDEGTYEVDGPR